MIAAPPNTECLPQSGGPIQHMRRVRGRFANKPEVNRVGLPWGLLALAALAVNCGLPQTAVAAAASKTPIQHVVVIFDENISFDHYFATYPLALNLADERAFYPTPGSPTVNGLPFALLTHNPNASNPFRLDRRHAVTCDMDHDYASEQAAYHSGLMNRFVESTAAYAARQANCDPKLIMGYYDGNTVTALWNYAQRFALNDNSFGTVFGPSTPGALNLFAAQTSGADQRDLPGLTVEGTIINDPEPIYDDCSEAPKLSISGVRTIGDLLNEHGLTWGWFQGGYHPTTMTGAGGTAKCLSKHPNAAGQDIPDYSPHHNPVAYFQQFRNPHHLPPLTIEAIGHTDQAMHQYGLEDFWSAVDNGSMPAVSFLKPRRAQDAHAGYSGPLDEQRFLVETINRLQQTPNWVSTAVILAYDDSDGWYDHVMPPIIRTSVSRYDRLTGIGHCGTALPGVAPGRCGYGPRLPLLVLSPYARRNFVDHTLTDQTSIARFIEENWGMPGLGEDAMDQWAGTLTGMFDFSAPRMELLLLDPATGAIAD
jgi:phospholipase C